MTRVYEISTLSITSRNDTDHETDFSNLKAVTLLEPCIFFIMTNMHCYT